MNFNTSHVEVYRLITSSTEWNFTISIHLMLKFIRENMAKFLVDY